MAMMGVLLGLFARVASTQGMFDGIAGGAAALDPEQGLPMLLSTILPVGLLGLMLSAYFSAILSTADSCLMAASGNFVSDIINRFFGIDSHTERYLRISQLVTLLLGVAALLLASAMTNVLTGMLYSYSFMVSGLLVPVIGAFYWRHSSATGAFWAMLVGGTTTVVLSILSQGDHPTLVMPWGLDPNIFGIAASLVTFVALSLSFPNATTETVKTHDDYLQHSSSG
jgi:SSS family solute:Na+ symporter